ncbi:hypothetical protein HMPREF0018_02506 [Acinetobacter radioresistens SH164]|nr:hypothetical protein HMPREF0018_02506 [Acinetobacter radioresistens SH164]
MKNLAYSSSKYVLIKRLKQKFSAYVCNYSLPS